MADFRSSLSATIATMPSNKSKGKVPLMKSHSRITGHCHTCQKSPQDLGRDKPFAACSKCREVVYCGVECQRENWPVHKLACALSRERKALLAGNPIKANNTARFTRWFDSPIKIDVFRQAVMHAMDVVNHPERVDQKVFLMECDLHPDHANRRPEDKYILKKGHMFPRDEVFRPDGGFNGGQHAHFLEYLKVQNDIVKRRGQLGVVPVIMLDVSCKDEGQMAMPNWWPLALPGMVEDARQILKDTKWGNVFWVRFTPAFFVSTTIHSDLRTDVQITRYPGGSREHFGIQRRRSSIARPSPS
uniref:MYND-type domain-containing protein n=1 Tax=Moniliophthora roreri TaxID=221103 RepID=A0A0W0FS35_MONRR